MRLLHGILLVGVAAAFAYSAATVRWQAELFDGSSTYSLDLGGHPVWSPPVPPDLAHFQERFANRPPRSGVARVRSDPGELVVFGLLYAWPVLAFCTVCYWLEHPNARDIVLHVAQWVTVALLVSGTLCLLLICVAGGYVLFPTAFALVGLVVGLWLGVGSYPPADGCRTGR